MKHSNKLRKLAVPALAVGCLGNYSSSEAMQSYNDILKSKSCEQKLSCKLEVKVKVDFQGAGGEFALFDAENNPQEKKIPFTVEGVSGPKIVMELDDCFKFSGEGTVKVLKTSGGELVDEAKAPVFTISVVGTDFDELFQDASGKKEVELTDKKEKLTYNIVITPSEITNDTLLGQYKTGSLKFSIISE